MDKFVYKPMKAINLTKTLEKIIFPVFISRKWDGIRCLAQSSTKLLSSSSSEFPQVQARPESDMEQFNLVPGREYEILHQDGNDIRPSFINGILASGTLNPEFDKLIFMPIMDYDSDAIMEDNIIVESLEELQEHIDVAVRSGWEGLMCRPGPGLNASYKRGKAGLRKQECIKIKFLDEDKAEILDWVPVMRNHNPAEKNNFGRTKRSTNAENLVEDRSEAGKLIVKVTTGRFLGLIVEMRGSIDRKTAQDIAANFDKYRGRIIEFEHKRPTPEDTVPMQPIFKRFVGDL